MSIKRYTKYEVARDQSGYDFIREDDHAAEVEALRADAERYRFLRDNSRCSMHLSHNDHRSVYETAASYLDEPQGYYSEVPADERAKMIATDTIWTFHEYPNTPVGFNVWHGATLDAAIDAARTAKEQP